MDDDEEGDAGPTAHPPSLSNSKALVGVAPPSGSGAPTGAVRGKEKRRVSRKDIMMGRLQAIKLIKVRRGLRSVCVSVRVGGGGRGATAPVRKAPSLYAYQVTQHAWVGWMVVLQ
jgi:hypothetical protein